MKKILFVIDSLTCGGAEKSLVTLLNNFDYSKFQVELMMMRRGGAFESMLPDDVKKVEAPCYFEQLQNQKRKSVKYFYYRLKTSICLRVNLLLRERYHSEQVVYRSIKNNIEMLGKEYDCAIAYSQGMPTYYVSKHVKAKKKLGWINCNYVATKYEKQLDQLFYKEINHVVVVSEYIKNSLTHYLFYNKLEVINDIVDPNTIYCMANNEKDYSYEMEFDGIKLLTVARLEKIKGYDLLLQVASLLKRKGINFKWYIIGEGSLRKEIETYCIDNGLENFVILLGQKNNPYFYMKKCDVYVQTSKNEGLGLTVIEAKILEKLIICTNFSTASSLIENNIDGILCSFSPDNIAENIIRLIEDEDLRNKLLRNIKTKSKFNTTSEVEKIFELLE